MGSKYCHRDQEFSIQFGTIWTLHFLTHIRDFSILSILVLNSTVAVWAKLLMLKLLSLGSSMPESQTIVEGMVSFRCNMILLAHQRIKLCFSSDILPLILVFSFGGYAQSQLCSVILQSIRVCQA